MKFSLLFFVSMGLFVTTSQGVQGEDDANSGALLALAPRMNSVVRFSETLGESLKIIRYREDGEWYREVEERVNGRSAIKVTGALGGFDPVALTDESEVGISIGNFSHSATLGERSAGSVAARRLVFHFVEEIEDDGEREVPRVRRLGSITYRWNSTSFTISASFKLAVGSVVSSSLAENDEVGRSRYSDQITCEVNLDGEESSRRVHAAGLVRVKRRIVGTVDDREEFFLASVSANGSADYRRPTVKISLPRNGSQVSFGDEEGVVASGSASDDRVLQSVWVRINEGEWISSGLLYKLLGRDAEENELYSIKAATWDSLLDLTGGGRIEGVVTLEAQAEDLDGNVSKIAKRTFTVPPAL